MINLFKADCWKSPTKNRSKKDVYAGDEVSPKGCTPHTDKKAGGPHGGGFLGALGITTTAVSWTSSNQTDAKFIR